VLAALASGGIYAHSGHTQASQQTLFLNPNPVITGGVVTASGSGFCANDNCSDVTIAADGNVLATNIEAEANGTFQAQFNAFLEPGLHTVTASQQSGGQTISATNDLIVTVSDPRTPPEDSTPKPSPPAETSEPTSQPSVTPTPHPPTPTPTMEPTPTAPVSDARPSIEVTPSTASVREEVTIVGQGFCGKPQCSPTAVSLDGHTLLSDVLVGSDGGFEQKFEAPDNPGRYGITASQDDGQGVLVAETTLLVESADSADGDDGVPWYTWLIVTLLSATIVTITALVFWRRRLAHN
jgi:hypothetical protein